MTTLPVSPETIGAILTILGGAIVWLVKAAFFGKHVVSKELTTTQEFAVAVDDRIKISFGTVATQKLIDDRVHEGLETFKQSVCLQEIIDDRFEHKMNSATMVFSAGLEIARGEIASMKAASDVYNQQHIKQHDELLTFMRRMEKKVDNAALAAAELRGRASVTDASSAATDDDETIFPEGVHRA